MTFDIIDARSAGLFLILSQYRLPRSQDHALHLALLASGAGLLSPVIQLSGHITLNYDDNHIDEEF